jgi:hypothetical protein
MGQPVPVERAIANVQAQLQTSPKDASAWLTLARLHSYAFFTGQPQVPMRNGKAYFSNLPHATPAKEPTAGSLAHLKESIAAFRKSISLDGNVPLAYLGLAWDLGQGAPYAGRIGAIPGEEGLAAKPSQWTERALENYRQAYDRAAKNELAMIGLPPGFEAISGEAAEGIIAIDEQRLKDSKRDQGDLQAEIARMKQSMTKMAQKPRAVTPIIFSFEERASLRDLTTDDVQVNFDLDGFGGSRWTWLKPATGILVWDPARTGVVQSGLQLFGPVTWWMFWRDGYQALAALDDNHDGWLSGAELRGLAVWIDRNQNGRSDAGEVIPVEDAGIVRIGVTAARDTEGTLGNAQGIEFSDGRRTPSFDWVSRGQAIR